MAIKIILLLTTLFVLSCSCANTKKSHTIAKISEASGICFDKISKNLFVVGDEGYLYKLDTTGNILQSKHLGDYDFEGIACDPKNNRLLLAVEGKDNILIVDPKHFRIQKEVNIKRSFHHEKLLVKDKKHGLEGITIHDKDIYLSNQSKHRYPHKDPSVIIKVNDLRSLKTTIKERIDPRRIDISGLDYHEGFLYMVSDTLDKVFRFNMTTHKIDKSAKLPKFAQEGITFDDQDNIYFANDKGSVLKYKREEIGI